mmetsp:Transcript_39743/g.81397  ORF Transcript_39743/g.81397 Transcript_39743/m.81397 type:complete len:320 (+) Transcript_39743:140-1099(+)
MVKDALQKRQHWFSRRPVYALSLALMLGLCLLSILYPARVVNDLVNLGPTTNQGGRRRYLMRACVHYARELVLDDGFSRMDKATITGALAHHLAELRTANDAVRLGGFLNVTEGADFRTGRNKDHNNIMYEGGCPWRENPTDCSIKGLPAVQIQGTYSLVLNFYEAVENVLSLYGVGEKEAAEAYERYLKLTPAAGSFTRVEVDAARVRLLSEDENLKFLVQAFKGDVFNGLGAALETFHVETQSILTGVHTEARFLFAGYMVSVMVLFYGMLFRKTMQTAVQEAVTARGFVHKLPIYVLSREETDVVREFFQKTLAES